MDILFLSLFYITAAAFGGSLLKASRFSFRSLSEEVFFSVIAGMGVLGYFVYFLGLAGFLSTGALFFLLALAVLVSAPAMAEMGRAVYEAAGKGGGKALSLLEKALLAVMAVVLLNTLMGALAPLTSNDNLAYRFVEIKTFLDDGRVGYIPYTRESLWPYLTEMLFLLGMAIRSDIAAKLVGWSFGITCCLGIYACLERFHSRKAGILSAAILLLTPSIFQHLTSAYVDLAMATYAFGALLAFFIMLDGRGLRWAVLAGVLCGFLMSMKHIALMVPVAAVIGISYYIIRYREDASAALKGAGAAAPAAVLFSFFWYLRSFILKGNPFYPFFGSFFGGAGWASTTADHIGDRFGLVNLMRMPWDATMNPVNYSDEHIGAVYLLLLPLFFLTGRKRKIYSFFGGFAAAFTLLWYYVDPKSLRYLYPAIPVLAVIAASSVMDIKHRDRFLYRTALTVFFAVAVFNLGLSFYYNAGRYAVALGLESKSSYLSRTERTYGMARLIRDNLPADAKIFMIGEIRAYYLDRPYIHANNYLQEKDIDPEKWSPEDMKHSLSSEGVNYILTSLDENYQINPMISDYLRGRKEVFSYSFRDREGVTHRYKVYNIS
ncbi:MAG: hypothetical protein GF408_01530 [Candidatus Omnitrophica bacterium]|nr:hypothetical protein [Candidatus Omnitrophota bacterium]